MNRRIGSGLAFAGLAVALLLSLAGLLMPRQPERPDDRVVMIGVRGLAWQEVVDRIEEGGLPTLAALVDGEAAMGDIIADGYGSEEEILASIATGRLPFKQPAEKLWDELSRQGEMVSVGGFPFGPHATEISDSEAAEMLLRDEPARHLFLYMEGLRGPAGEPLQQGYDLLDELLGRLIAADRGRSTFLLFSEKGNPEGRITYRPHFPELSEWPAIGFFLAWGKHVKASAQPHTVAPVDLAPTLLHVCGAKVPNDMDGLVLFQVFDDGFYHKRRLAFRP